MAETAAIPPPLVVGIDTSNNNLLKASRINEVRIDSVIERLKNRLHGPAHFDAAECADLCLSLARGIDFCVSNEQIPAKAQQLPLLLKQIFQPKHDALLLAAIMVLMISVKSANQSNWFPEKDSEELRSLMNEIGKHFCSSMDFSIEPSSSHPIISTIMSSFVQALVSLTVGDNSFFRFYPKMKIGQILFVLEAKPGFGAYVKDFRLAKQMRKSLDEVVRLLVARTDNAETSTCLVSPPQVNFLLNGKGVEKRVNISMDVGPQMPTNVTNMLKYGCNLLQAIGDFNGSYIIVMAIMSETPILSNLEIEDYVQPATTLVDPDSDLIEGPSRISLNCPISIKRIKTPVKGHSCKHHQCFDRDNYLDINSKKPSWRCPICNTHVCFTDIRIDQNMAKVLSDIGENVNNVIISSDGSWKAVMESDDHTEKQRERISGEDVDMSEQIDTTQFLIGSPDLMDLTGLDDEMESIGIIDSVSVDKKVPHTHDNYWSGVFLSTFPSQTTNDMLQEGVTNTIVDPSPTTTNVVLPPLTAADVINREAGPSILNSSLAISSPLQNEISSPNGWQLQQYQQTGGDVGTNSNKDYGRSSYLPLSRNITRTPNAVQALPAQQASNSSNPPGFQRQRSMGGSSWVPPPSGSMNASQPNNGTPSPRSVDVMANLFSRSHSNSLRPSHMLPHLSPNGQYMRPLSPVVQSQQTAGVRVPNQRPSTVQYQPVSQSSPYTQTHGVQGGPRGMSGPRIGHLPYMNNGPQRAAQSPMPFLSPRTTSPLTGTPPAEGNARMPRSGGSTTHTVVTEGPMATAFEDLTGGSGGGGGGGDGGGGGGGGSDQDWRPTGRMRGSLQGRAYNDALSQYTLKGMAPSQQQIQMANRAALNEANRSSGLSNSSTPSGVLPHIRSPRMN